MPAYMRGFPAIFNVFYRYGGDVGNTVFFMISGFCLSYTYSEKVHELSLGDF